MKKLLSITEFSKFTGFSIRTLHFYDKEGILRPHSKNNNGFRYYSPEDALIAQKISTLKYIGFNLKQIKQILENDKFDLLNSLKLQANALRESVAQINKSLIIVEESIKYYSNHKEINWPQISQILKTFKISHSDLGLEWAERNFSIKERKFFEQKKFQRVKINYEQPWVNLFSAARTYMHEKKDPLSHEVQNLAQKWINLWAELSQEQYPNNPELAEKIWELMKAGDIPDGLIAGYDHQVILYMNQAMEHREFLNLGIE